MSNAAITTIETHTPPNTSDNVRSTTTTTTAHNSSSSSDNKEGEEEKQRLLSTDTDNSNNNNHREQADEVISSSMLRPNMSSNSGSGNSNNSNSGGAIQRKSVSSGHGNSNEGVGMSFSDNGGGMNRVIGSSSASLNGGGVGSSMNSGNVAIPAQRALAASNNLVVGKVKRDSCGTQPFDKRWLNKDCCGLFCAGFTYSLHMYGCFAVCFKLLKPWFYNHDSQKWGIFGIIHILLFCSIAALACANHFLAMTTDPGAVPPDAVPLPDPEKGIDEMTALNLNPAKLGRRFCRRCNAYKPKRAHHCSICKRCVVKMDHHCPWVNNCVGIGNHKFFLLFIFYTFLSCIYSFSLLLWRGLHCGFLGRGENSCMEKPGDFGFLVGLAIEALIFGLFTSCMIVDQHETVSTNLTQIDRLKGEVHSNLPDINEVFGGNGVSSRCRLDWLAPVAVKFPTSIRDEIYGFCRPCINTSKQKARGDVEMGPINKATSFELSSVDIV